ncbi:MAG: ORF6N domain-containing protein [Alphaproteobacteria bacterium]|nr:ORF6N domain-containing protein [Alphaproteobacteria bacterium]
MADVKRLESVSIGDVVMVRGERVMLDQRVAVAFGTETKRVNEAVARNREKFDETHCFQLSEVEFDALKSQSATPNKGRGGRRLPPHVFTVKGVARLATVLTTPAALRATDLIIDTFLLVQAQLSEGRRTISVPEPDRYRATDEHRDEIAKLRKRLAGAVARLLDTMIDAEGEQTLRQASQTLGSKAIANIQERLRSKGLENAKLEADSSLVLAQAEKVLAEARKARAEADGIDIDNFERRISAVRKVAGLIRELEPPEVVGLIEGFDEEPLRLEAPEG